MPVKPYFVSLISFAVLDFLWLGYVMKKFNLRQLAEIGRIEDGDFRILYVPAGTTYFLMAGAITFFVLPRVQDASWFTTFTWGAFMGLIVYGIFDMTNMAILKGYPVPFLIADMAWGTFVFGAVTLITKRFR